MKHDTLYVTDLDGTLLGTDSRVSERSAEILSELSASGSLISVATARTPATVEPLLRRCGLRLPVIVFTGAAMWDLEHHRYISPQFIDPATVERICRACHKAGAGALRYALSADGMIHACFSGPAGAAPTEKERKFIDERRGLELKRFHINEPDADTLLADRSILVLATGSTGPVTQAAEWLRATGGCSVSCYPDIFDSSTSYLEVLAPGVSKAAAVQKLKDMTGARRLMVFGDNLNDIPMMEVADVSVAVANAMSAVLETATETIGPNGADSVALKIASEETR